MRVLHVYHDFHPVRGGIEDYLAGLVRAQTVAGLEVSVLCANTRPVTRVANWHGVRVVRAAAFGRYFTPLCPGWLRWIRELKPELVHLHLPCPMGEWSLLLSRVPRVVVSLHNEYVRPRWAVNLHRPLHRAVLKRAGAVIVSSDDYAQTSAVLQHVRRKICVVPYGIDVQRYTKIEGEVAPVPLKRKKGTGVLFAGRLCYYKGAEVLLEAAPFIREQVCIVGDGAWRPRLEAQASRLDLEAQVRFYGAVSEAELIQHMHASGVFVFPSTERSEAFGIVQLKAMACGLPVVSSDLAGVRWLNKHHETGLTVPVRNVQALADAVNSLTDDEPTRARMASAAQARARQFTLARMVSETQRVYQTVN